MSGQWNPEVNPSLNLEEARRFLLTEIIRQLNEDEVKIATIYVGNLLKTRPEGV